MGARPTLQRSKADRGESDLNHPDGSGVRQIEISLGERFPAERARFRRLTRLSFAGRYSWRDRRSAGSICTKMQRQAMETEPCTFNFIFAQILICLFHQDHRSRPIRGSRA